MLCYKYNACIFSILEVVDFRKNRLLKNIYSLKGAHMNVSLKL